jgi:uncharacterized repeat protein (TIGR03803 family)
VTSKVLTVLSLASLLTGTVVTRSAEAQAFTTLHNFAGYPADGAQPYAGLLRDASGNLYGTTVDGGPSTNCGGYGCGTVFKIDPSGTLTLLHSFSGNDGASPYGGLTLDSSGNLYGTTYYGGSSGQGTVFKLDTSGKNFTVLHNFGDGTVTPDGAHPIPGLILDSSGKLYGTTDYGGSAGQGTVFEIAAAGGTLTVLHNFGDGTLPNDGAQPWAGLVLDSSGNLYGTTTAGGSANQGTVFKIPTAGGTLTVLHNFSDGTVTDDGAFPTASLILDSSGNLYGPTPQGGSASQGTIFKIPAAGGPLTVLHSFGDGTVTGDGVAPGGGLVLDSSGNLYGTASSGGSSNDGMVFKFSISGGTLTPLHSFDAADGAEPTAALVRDALGNLYGTTFVGGPSTTCEYTSCGTVFEINTTPQAATQTIMNQVNALYAQGVLNSGQDNSLITELQQALTLINKGKKAGAIQNLEYFIAEVQDLQSSGVLTSSQAQPLITEAQAVIAELQ